MISCAVLHTPWRDDRVRCLAEMLSTLNSGVPLRVFGERNPGFTWSHFKTRLAMNQWDWALSTGATHHLFVTDDLHLAPRFWEILTAMVTAKPDAIIGLLSNHPKGPELSREGLRWYRCNSWVVGPAYVVPRRHLEPFLQWYKALPDNEEPKGRRWFNDDSALNEWNTFKGPGESWHPLPTCIEHRGDLPSTVGHGDQYSRERVSWRAVRSIQHHEDGFTWFSDAADYPLAELVGPAYWMGSGPMLGVGG